MKVVDTSFVRKAFLRSLWIGLTMLLAGVYVIYQAHAHANGTSIGGRTNKGGNTVGCTCHCAASDASTTVTLSTTATTFITGQSYTFTVTVNNSTEAGAGVEVSTARGSLTAGSGMQLISGELTHTAAKTSLPATWSFTYTAPNVSGGDTLFSTGNAVNLDGMNGGGNCSDKWNFSSKYIVNVVDPPVTKAITISRNSIAIGSVRVGQVRKDTLQIRSTSTAAISVSTAMKTGSVFSRFPTSSNRSIASGATEIDTLFFAPTSRGAFNDSLIVTSDVDAPSNQRKAVYVTGTGVAAIYSGGTSLVFNSLRVNQSRSLGFVYSNTGDDTLFTGDPTISGTGFTITGQPTHSILLPGVTDSIIVRFSPTAQTSYSGTLTLTATGFTIPSVSLSGTGVAPTIAVTTPTNIGGVRVGAQTQGTLVIRNTGTDSLHLSGVTLSGANAARFNIASFSPAIAAAGQGVVLVNYFPTVEKYDTAIATIASDDASNATINVTVIAQGLAPHITVQPNDTLDFGNVRINSAPASRDITVQNIGSDVLNLSSAVVTPSPFSLKSKPSSVDPGSSGLVSINFAPTVVGPFKGSVTISSDDARKPTTVVYVKGSGTNSALNVPSNVDFLGVPTSTSHDTIITLQNAGSAGVNILKYTLTDANGVFTIKDSSAHSIGGNSSIHVTLSFKPLAASSYSGTLTLTTDDPNAATRTIGLAGQGLAGALSFSSTSIDFGQVDSAKHVMLPLDITNSGSSGITIVSAVLTGADASAFTVQSLSATIAPGQKLRVAISFDPSVPGQYSANLRITTNDAKTTDVKLSGIGVSVPKILPDTINVQLISDSTQKISISLKVLGAKSWDSKITNNSGHRVKIDGISLKHGVHFTESLSSPDSTIPFYLADKGSIIVRITLTESIPGDYQDTLSVGSEQGITNTLYAIDATLKTLGVAMSQPKSFIMTANPNPSHSQVVFNFEGVRSANVEVLDLMGRVVASANNIGSEWRWNGQNANGEIAPTGFYIVRATAKTLAGESVTSSTRIVIAH
jgi:hypothetical protein